MTVSSGPEGSRARRGVKRLWFGRLGAMPGAEALFQGRARFNKSKELQVAPTRGQRDLIDRGSRQDAVLAESRDCVTARAGGSGRAVGSERRRPGRRRASATNTLVTAASGVQLRRELLRGPGWAVAQLNGR